MSQIAEQFPLLTCHLASYSLWKTFCRLFFEKSWLVVSCSSQTVLQFREIVVGDFGVVLREET